MATGGDPLQRAIALHQAGHLPQAEQLYRQILAAHPQHPDALHLLGLVAHQVGNHSAAIESIRRAIGIQGANPFYHNSLGEAHRAQGQIDEARACYSRALELDASLAAAHYNLGLTYGEAEPLEAQRHYQRAVKLVPEYAAAHNNLGCVLRAQGKLDEAADAFRRAVACPGENPLALANLGVTLTELGRAAEAIPHLERVARLSPQSAQAHYNLGCACKSAGEPRRAVECLQTALQLQPDFVDAQAALAHAEWICGRPDNAARGYAQALERDPRHVDALLGYGRLLEAQGLAGESLRMAERLLKLRPEMAAAHYNRGTALRLIGRLDDAAGAFREAIRLEPDYVEAYENLAVTYQASFKPDEAIECCRRGLEVAPESSSLLGSLAYALHAQGRGSEAIEHFRRLVAKCPDDAAAHSSLLFALNFVDGFDPQTVYDEHLAWARAHAEPLTATAVPHVRRPGEEKRRLKIGYVSPHFYQHAVNYFVEPILHAHDHAQFEVFCYSDVHRPDSTTDRLRAAADHWRDVLLQSDEQLAQIIRADGIDVLVDLAGHMGRPRLLAFARRPAPVQVTYIGYQNTTGMSAMDYRLTDARADPPGATDRYYSEQLVRLPRSFFCYQPIDCPEVTPLPALESGRVTFGSFNNFMKITPRVIDAWLEILARVPDSRLMVIACPPGYAEEHLHDLAVRRGLDPARIDCRRRANRPDYLRLIQQTDVALDPFPFNGHTTTCDAIWMGVPVVMLQGHSYQSRFGGCALAPVGLDHLVADSTEQYVEIATRLAGDLDQLARLRGELRPRMAASVLLDFAGFTRNLEAACRQMWRAWCNGETLRDQAAGRHTTGSAGG